MRRPSRSKPRAAPSPAYLLGCVWGLLVGCIPLADFLSRPARTGLAEYNYDLIREAPPILSAVLMGSLLLSAIPVLLAALRSGVDFAKAGFYPILALCMVLVIAVSLIGSAPSTVGYIIVVTYCFALATTLSALATDAEDMVRGLLSGVAVGIAIAMSLMVWDGNYSYGRLMGRSGPNYWGMNALTAFFAAFAIRNLAVRIAIIGCALAVVLLCQSRGAMMAIAAGSSMLWFLFAYHASSRQRLILIGVTTLIIVAVALAGYDVIADKLLLVNDRGRGVDSDGTGRFAAWVQAFELFQQSPWFGIGYRQHERFITVASSAHNAYLATLAEMGLFGLVLYLGLMLGGAVLAVRKALARRGDVQFAIAGFAVAFLVVGVVERVGMTTGNAMSLIMIYSSAWAFRREAMARRIRWVHGEVPSAAAAMRPSLR
jgi:O-antigen ligase